MAVFVRDLRNWREMKKVEYWFRFRQCHQCSHERQKSLHHCH